MITVLLILSIIYLYTGIKLTILLAKLESDNNGFYYLMGVLFWPLLLMHLTIQHNFSPSDQLDEFFFFKLIKKFFSRYEQK